MRPLTVAVAVVALGACGQGDTQPDVRADARLDNGTLDDGTLDDLSVDGTPDDTNADDTNADDTNADDTNADDTNLAGETAADRFPDVIDVVATYDDGSETWSFDVTMTSPYDTPERYADGWRVVGPAGTVYGTHTLTHDHANEQPFTRRQTGVAVPAGVDEVTIEGRDLANGYGGRSVVVSLSPD